MTERKKTTAEIAREVEELKEKLAHMTTTAARVEQAAKETHDKVAQLFDALIVPEPGQEKGLLDRMAKLTTEVEGGKATAAFGMKIIAGIMALGAFVGSIKLGLWPHIE